ncbi:SDR family NAD(P)-dependent oxidoreductase [Candidatus Marsarchaeota archaeon]|nr:SDR family NAD(P)-dependent oxidoreductase [Candidatus Marsarchaeota archaeon]
MTAQYKKILVAGGAGFIGSCIVDHLAENGYRIKVIDDLSSGKEANLKQHIGKGYFELIKGDITDAEVVSNAVEGVDAVINMVGKGDLAKSVENPLFYHKVNLTGNLNLLTAASKKNIKKFIFASSGSVYSAKAVGVISENAEYGPESPYGATKVCNEVYCRTFNIVYGMECICFRFFNVYGPRRENSTYGGAVTNFMLNVMNGKDVTIFGTGKDRRDYVYVKDVAAAVLLGLKSGVHGEFNVGTGQGTSTNELFSKIEKVVGKKANIIRAPARKGDSPSRIANISKISAELGYLPKYGLEAGLAELKSYLENRK